MSIAEDKLQELFRKEIDIQNKESNFSSAECQ